MIKILNRITVKRLWNKNDMPSDSFRRSTIRRLADLLRSPYVLSRWSFAWAGHHLTWRHKDRAISRRPIPQVRVIRCGASSMPATSYTSILQAPLGTTIDRTRSMSPLPNGSWIALTIVNSQHLLARTVPARQPYASKRSWIESSCHPGIRFPIWRRSSPPVDARNCQSIEFRTPESQLP